MLQFLQKTKGWLNLRKWPILAVFATLFLKKYFNGGTCKQVRNVTNQVVAITGANTGIGFQTARHLASNGAKVLLLCRDKKRGQCAVQEIKNKYPNAHVQLYQMDLGSIQSIKKCAQQIKRKYNQIDILINNAGVMALPERKQTLDGFQMQFGTNHLGHFLLTSQLMDLLKNAHQARIINVSSKSHLRSAMTGQNAFMKFNDLNHQIQYNPFNVYSRSKLANVLFTNKLNRLFSQQKLKIKTFSVHPGVVRTQLSRYFVTGFKSLIIYILYPLFFLMSKSSYQGAQTTLYLVYQKYQNLISGQYYADCQITPMNPYARIVQDQDLLWEKSQELLGSKFKIGFNKK